MAVLSTDVRLALGVGFVLGATLMFFTTVLMLAPLCGA